MGDEWTALEQYLRTGAELVAEARKHAAAEPLPVPPTVEEVPA